MYLIMPEVTYVIKLLMIKTEQCLNVLQSSMSCTEYQKQKFYYNLL